MPRPGTESHSQSAEYQPAAVEPIRAAAAKRPAVLWGVALVTVLSLAINIRAATDGDVHLWKADSAEKVWDGNDPPFLR